MKKLAVLYICTGKYVVFWENFFRSAEAHLLPDTEKHYFVFTDANTIAGIDTGRVNIIYQQPLVWPYPTLYRFRFFLSIEAQLKDVDFIYFFNSNIRIVRTVTEEEFLPDDASQQLVVTQHPYFWNKKSNKQFTYDRNPHCKAFVAEGEGELYAAGGLNGGTAECFLTFAHVCNEMTEEDLKKGIIARWHDESYLNRYIIGKKIKVLHPGFLYPAETTIPFEKVFHLERKEDFLKGFGKYAEEEKQSSKQGWLMRLFSKRK